MYKRNLSNIIDNLLRNFPAVVLTGARQCGKSFLAKCVRPDWEYFDLERQSVRELILSDIELFLKNHRGKVILDEAQLFPEILAALRSAIDEDRDHLNRFLITGSSSPELLKVAAESLAGRAGIVELAPLKMNEVCGEPLPDFYRIFENRFSLSTIEVLRSLKPTRSYNDVIHCWLHGGYPEPLQRDDGEFYRLWPENYLKTYVERDIKRLFPQINDSNYRKFISVLKDFHGQSINLADIARSLLCSETTVKSYIDVANYSFIWRFLGSYERTTLRSIVKHPRGMYRDSGVFHFLSSISTAAELEVSRYKGHSFECFVIEEITRGLAATSASNLNSYFFRTRGGSEVDLVLEGSFGVLPIEIKCASSVTAKDVQGLVDFIDREGCQFGLVVNFCDSVNQIAEKVFTIPVTLI